MAKPRPGMGRGLDAILSVSGGAGETPAEELRELPVELIVANPKQPRRRFDEEALQALAGSLGERGRAAAGARAPRSPAAPTS